MNIKQFIRNSVNHVLYYLSFLVPKDKNLWVFIGWHGQDGSEIFADNCKYLFLHVANTEKNITAVWLAKDKDLESRLCEKGYLSYYHYNLKGIWSALRAGTTIIDAYLQPENFRFSGGTCIVQLLHGKGMKKGGYHLPPPRRQDYIFSTSPFVNEMLPKAFVQETKISIAGYSRGDVFFRKIRGSEVDVDIDTITLLKDTHYKKHILYAPTFRRGATVFNIEEILNLKLISKWLTEQGYLLMISLHPKYHEQTRNLVYTNVHFIKDSDIYPILTLTDVLINDYSSIFTDFLLLDRPIIFYPYDLEEYSKNEGLSYNYDDYTPGPKAYTSRELLKTLEETLKEDTYSDARARVRNLYHTYIDGNSSERIMTTLLDR